MLLILQDSKWKLDLIDGLVNLVLNKGLSSKNDKWEQKVFFSN